MSSALSATTSFASRGSSVESALRSDAARARARLERAAEQDERQQQHGLFEKVVAHRDAVLAHHGGGARGDHGERERRGRADTH
jgi:hypothetical protein